MNCDLWLLHFPNTSWYLPQGFSGYSDSICMSLKILSKPYALAYISSLVKWISILRVRSLSADYECKSKCFSILLIMILRLARILSTTMVYLGPPIELELWFDCAEVLRLFSRQTCHWWRSVDLGSQESMFFFMSQSGCSPHRWTSDEHIIHYICFDHQGVLYQCASHDHWWFMDFYEVLHSNLFSAFTWFHIHWALVHPSVGICLLLCVQR